MRVFSVQSGLGGGEGVCVRGVCVCVWGGGGGVRSKGLWRKSMQYLNCSHISTEKNNSVMRTRVFVHMRTMQAQISMQNRTAWWMQKLSADRIIGYYTMYKWRAKAQTVLWACTSWSASVHFVHIWRHSCFHLTLQKLWLPSHYHLAILFLCSAQLFHNEWNNRWGPIKETGSSILSALPFRKHAYSNIIKILQPKMIYFWYKILIFFILLLKI